jgi:hypothetical protein
MAVNVFVALGEPKVTTITSVRQATQLERIRFLNDLYLAYYAKHKDPFNYSRIHGWVQLLQPKVRQKFAIDLGYEFGVGMYGPWSDRLEEDLAILNSMGLVKNDDDKDSETVQHQLQTTDSGKFYADYMDHMSRRASPYLFGHKRQEIQNVLVETVG